MNREMMLANFEYVDQRDPFLQVKHASIIMLVDMLQPELTSTEALFSLLTKKEKEELPFDWAAIKKKACYEFIKVTKQTTPHLKLKSFSLSQVLNPDDHAIPPYKPEEHS